jgi:putative transposase
VAGSIRFKRVIEVVSKLISSHGAPPLIRPDNGLVFVSCAILEWRGEAGVRTAVIDPGKPWQNASD